MPRKNIYDPNCIESAINEIKCNGMSLRAAAKKYGIPKSTLEFKLKNPGYKNTCGPSPILTRKEELELVQWIEDLAKRGFPRKKDDICNSVQKFLDENPRSNPFRNNRPGECWFKAFLRRHPTIVQRTSEAVSAASSCVAESNIRKWFQEINTYLVSKNIDINDPSRVYNGDETGFQICPSTGKVFAGKGMKNVYTIDKGSQKENITVMFSFSASGLTCPPMVIYPYKRIPEKISSTVNSTWGIGRSDNGWMTAEIFYDYVKNIFYPYLVENKVFFPVILFLDGHKSHLTYELSQLCNELNIEIIALYPNATRILQPCDVAVFRAIKIGWKKAVREFYANNPGEILNKTSFAPLLETVVTKVIKPETLINGFKACGLFPFNPDAIDFSKCLGKDDKSREETHLSSMTMDYKTFLNFLGEELTTKFTSLDAILNNETFNDEFVTLYKMWQFFKADDKVEDKNNNRLEVEKNYTLQNKALRTAAPKIDSTILQEINIVENIMIKPADTSVSSTNVLDTDTLIIAPSSNCKSICHYLEVPDRPERKNRRDTERVPFAVTSKIYQEIFERKRSLKQEEEKRKAERKRKREESTATKNKKTRKVKSKAISNNCFVCRKIKTNLTCDTCKNHFHSRCIPKKHKNHVPDVDDNDPFMCHVCYKEESEEDDDDKKEALENSFDANEGREEKANNGEDDDEKMEALENSFDANERREEKANNGENKETENVAEEMNEREGVKSDKIVKSGDDVKDDENEEWDIDTLFDMYKTEYPKYY